MNITSFLTVFIAFAISFAFATKSAATISIQVEKASEVYEDIELVHAATLQIDQDATKLTKVSHGLLKKALFGLVPVKVYVLQFFAANPAKLVKTEPDILKSLKESGPVLLQMDFLRNLPSTKISEAFKEGLELNKISTRTSPELKQILDEVASFNEFKKKEILSIAITWKDNRSTIFLEQAGSEVKSITGPSEFAEQFLSIWFGKSSDGKIANLKKSLLQ
jgi:hypothetical protein